MKLKSVKFWNMVGVCIGIAVIILGIVIACTPADTYSTSTNSQKITFGADYYTYQYEASRNAAGNAAVAANNLRELGGKLALYAGLLFVVIGLLTTLKYAKKFFLEEDFDFFEEDDFDFESAYGDEELDAPELVVVDEEETEEAVGETVEEVSAETENI